MPSNVTYSTKKQSLCPNPAISLPISVHDHPPTPSTSVFDSHSSLTTKFLSFPIVYMNMHKLNESTVMPQTLPISLGLGNASSIVNITYLSSRMPADYDEVAKACWMKAMKEAIVALQNN